MQDFIEHVEITAAYSNAVLLAVLPHISNFAERLELPIQIPITTQQVVRFSCDNHRNEVGGALELTNGSKFWFTHGYVDTFETPRSFSVLQDPKRIPEFFGRVAMEEREAIELARETISRMGYSPELVYADLPPRVTSPPRVGEKEIPRSMIEWLDPKDGTTSARFEIDTGRKSVARFFLPNRNLWRSPPELNPPITPPAAPPFKSAFASVSPSYSNALLLAILPELDEVSRKLELPISTPVSTNQLAEFVCRMYFGDIVAELELTNGFRFVYFRGLFSEIYAPDRFFSKKKGALIKDYIGKWKLTDKQAVAFARECIHRLGLDGQLLGLDENPEIRRPFVVQNVPRLELLWQTGQNGVARSIARLEIDAENRKMKALFVRGRGLARPLPRIDVPMDAGNANRHENMEQPPSFAFTDQVIWRIVVEAFFFRVLPVFLGLQPPDQG